jgi:hypothetical protein
MLMIIKVMKTLFYILQQMSMIAIVSILTFFISIILSLVFTVMYFKNLIQEKLKWT